MEVIIKDIATKPIITDDAGIGIKQADEDAGHDDSDEDEEESVFGRIPTPEESDIFDFTLDSLIVVEVYDWSTWTLSRTLRWMLCFHILFE